MMGVEEEEEKKKKKKKDFYSSSIRLGFDGNGKPLLAACQIGTIENRYQPVAK